MKDEPYYKAPGLTCTRQRGDRTPFPLAIYMITENLKEPGRTLSAAVKHDLRNLGGTEYMSLASGDKRSDLQGYVGAFFSPILLKDVN